MVFTLVAEGGSFTDVLHHPATVLWAWVAFLATLWALNKMAWPLLQKKMEEREVRIREGLQKAEEAEARARELMEKQEAILDEARQEAQKLLAEARTAATHVREQAVTAAQTEIQEQRERARKEIQLERAKAIDELKRAAIDLTLEAAGRVLEREMRDEDHRRLAEEAIAEVTARA